MINKGGCIEMRKEEDMGKGKGKVRVNWWKRLVRPANSG